MVKKAVGLVFLAESTQADDIIDQFQQDFDVQVLHVETSYGKLWIAKTEQQEGDNDQN